MSDDVMIIEKSELVFDDRWSDTDKRFITHYLGDCTLNAAAAGRAAGIPHANAIAYRYLKKPHIQEAIAQFLDDLAMERDEVLARLSEMARASISDFLTTNERGEIELDFNKIVEKGYLVKSAYRTREGFRLELHDAQKALEIIAKHLKLLSDSFDVNVYGGGTDERDSLYVRSLMKVYRHHQERYDRIETDNGIEVVEKPGLTDEDRQRLDDELKAAEADLASETERLLGTDGKAAIAAAKASDNYYVRDKGGRRK